MEPLYKVVLKEIWGFITDRVFILSLVFFGLFSILLFSLYDLQVVRSEEYKKMAKPTYQKTIETDAPRGEIFDRLGRPLAINETAFCIKIDPSIPGNKTFDMYRRLVYVLEKEEEELLLTFPFSYEPLSFDFDGSQTKEDHFKKDMGILPEEVDEYDALKTYGFILRLFEVIDKKTKDDDLEKEAEIVLNDFAKRDEIDKALSIACAVYQERFRLSHITVALNVTDRTVATIEERSNEFPGAYADIIYLRQYPGGEEFSHISGYIRKISQEELEDNEDYGYTSEDMFGKVGLERAFEEELHGKKGEKVFEVDAAGRQIGVISETKPVAGDDIFLTLDIEFQKEVVEIIEKTLREILLGRLQGKDSTGNINMQTLFSSMIEGYTIDADIIVSENSKHEKLKEKIIKYTEIPMAEWKKGFGGEILLELFENGSVSQAELLLFLYEDGQISLTEDEIEELNQNKMNIRNFVIKKVEAGEITPQMTNIEPFSASAVVLDISDGAVLASATYPNYDNNQFVNQFNNDYFMRLQKDPTLPMINRPFSEGRAPGSTFKVLTAFAGLDSNTVSVNEKIRDYGTFTKAGVPYAHCNTRVAGYHGMVDVRKAIEVSCNYYFYETSFRMNHTEENKTGIELFNEYMKKFGIGEPTGIEISEMSAVLPGPAYKEEVILSNPSATTRDAEWNDGDTIRAAIGQSVSKITPATMAKYISVIANGGKRYSLHFLHEKHTGDGNKVIPYTPNLELEIEMQEDHVTALHEGMRRVIVGDRGTARGIFAGFPMEIAGKTGTAQEQNRNHASFACFAPYEEPEIALYVIMPFSENTVVRSPSAEISKQILAAYYDLELSNKNEVEDEEEIKKSVLVP